MRLDTLNDAIAAIKNGERSGKDTVELNPASKVILEVLKVFQEEGYIDEFEVEKNRKGGSINVHLKQMINECGVIKPRFPVKHDEFTDWEKQYLPSRDFGALVVSTSSGIVSHKTAIKEGLGGRLIAYVY